MIRSDVLFYVKNIFLMMLREGERLPEIDSVDLYSGAKVLPICCHFAIFMPSQKAKKATLRWLFLFPNSLNYQQVLYGAQGGT
ncbi:hypothetical protein BB987_09410 [Photorhabdus temperata]|uniref:Uncharacterized protein n=1 Tax=Photorhabdus khanii NC19 TaxID=1004151 RepID=W3V5R1_9GAMM|nr:hypothetical protein [Photorhabdus khanii]ETS31118.1 hypothetical protein PTE_03070 [Photorhabdus khanii NC19]OHV54924.1 hypothetical protein BB987_09410 [Photorhabdus temperata]